MILSLFDRSGVAVAPWVKAGFECLTIDIDPADHTLCQSMREDVNRYNSAVLRLISQASFVMAFPPCTHLASSGAIHWRAKGEANPLFQEEAVSTARIAADYAKCPYMIENPKGALSRLWRKADYTFNPCDYARFSTDPVSQAYTKRTCLWTSDDFIMPIKWGLPPFLGSITDIPGRKSSRHAKARSVTPEGFANAVFLANHWRIKK